MRRRTRSTVRGSPRHRAHDSRRPPTALRRACSGGSAVREALTVGASPGSGGGRDVEWFHINRLCDPLGRHSRHSESRMLVMWCACWFETLVVRKDALRAKTRRIADIQHAGHKPIPQPRTENADLSLPGPRKGAFRFYGLFAGLRPSTRQLARVLARIRHGFRREIANKVGKFRAYRALVAGDRPRGRSSSTAPQHWSRSGPLPPRRLPVRAMTVPRPDARAAARAQPCGLRERQAQRRHRILAEAAPHRVGQAPRPSASPQDPLCAE